MGGTYGGRHAASAPAAAPFETALSVFQAAEAGVKDVAAALQQLKTTRVDADKEEVHPCDAALRLQADGLIIACQGLCQQVKSE